jgi:hypothetical protein
MELINRVSKQVSTVFSKFKNRFINDQAEEEFISFVRRKWPASTRHEDSDAVVLVDLFQYYPALHPYAAVSNILGKLAKAKLRSFLLATDDLSRLGIPHRRFERIYEAFGAPVELTIRNGFYAKQEASRYAEEVFAGLKSKTDVLELKLDGLLVGDFIYDTYLRRGYATVDIRDPRLKKDIEDAFLIYKAVTRYFTENKVVAVITSHSVYNSHGILMRYVKERSIPMIHVRGDAIVSRISDLLVDTPEYYRSRERFEKLDPKIREEALVRAKEALTKRLTGGVDEGIAYMTRAGVSGRTGYGAHSARRITQPTDKPKILVLLSCFFDSPHCFRWFLFPDFWDWIIFLLDHASQTDFEWYVKPHPSALPGNEKFIEELAKRYPKIHFLTVDDSNKQLVDEGVCAMFTTYGTAGHEFAYMGVPTVNAGDNPHIEYEFNLNPKTIEEYKATIYAADRLQVKMDRAEVERFFVTHAFYPYSSPKLEIENMPARAIRLGIPEMTSEFLKLPLEAEKTGENEPRYRYYEEVLREFKRD